MKVVVGTVRSMPFAPAGDTGVEERAMDAETSEVVTIPHGELIVLQCRVCREDVCGRETRVDAGK